MPRTPYKTSVLARGASITLNPGAAQEDVFYSLADLSSKQRNALAALGLRQLAADIMPCSGITTEKAHRAAMAKRLGKLA